jgi:hypothetical protein
VIDTAFCSFWPIQKAVIVTPVKSACLVQSIM